MCWGASRRLLDCGVRVALATDNVPTSLFYLIWQAVSRYNRYVDAPVGAEQSLTREEALRCAAVGGAELSFEEDDKGSIEVGKLADMAILSEDPLDCAEEEIKDIVAEMTLVGGKVVFDRSSLAVRRGEKLSS